MGPSQDLDDLLRRCTVRLRVPQDESQGTGFWKAPGLLLTCAHVVETAHARSVLSRFLTESVALHAGLSSVAHLHRLHAAQLA